MAQHLTDTAPLAYTATVPVAFSWKRGEGLPEDEEARIALLRGLLNLLGTRVRDMRRSEHAHVANHLDATFAGTAVPFVTRANAFAFRVLEPGDEPLCAICATEMQDENVAFMPACAHVFHEMCFRRFLLDGDRRCPTCRVWCGKGMRLTENEKGVLCEKMAFARLLNEAAAPGVAAPPSPGEGA